jgi:hypothetical protein
LEGRGAWLAPGRLHGLSKPKRAGGRRTAGQGRPVPAQGRAGRSVKRRLDGISPMTVREGKRPPARRGRAGERLGFQHGDGVLRRRHRRRPRNRRRTEETFRNWRNSCQGGGRSSGTRWEGGVTVTDTSQVGRILGLHSGDGMAQGGLSVSSECHRRALYMSARAAGPCPSARHQPAAGTRLLHHLRRPERARPRSGRTGRTARRHRRDLAADRAWPRRSGGAGASWRGSGPRGGGVKRSSARKGRARGVRP